MSCYTSQGADGVGKHASPEGWGLLTRFTPPQPSRETMRSRGSRNSARYYLAIAFVFIIDLHIYVQLSFSSLGIPLRTSLGDGFLRLVARL